MYLIFDTETTGLPKDWNAPISDIDNWPKVCQIAWQLHDEWGNCVEHKDYLVALDEGYEIGFDTQKIHGISNKLAQTQGKDIVDVLNEFNEVLNRSQFIVGQNLGFDINVLGSEFIRKGVESHLVNMPHLDTCTEKTAQLCQIPGGRGGKFKLPKLGELHHFLFGKEFAEAHNATADVEATTRCFFELLRQGNYSEEELKQASGYLEAFKTKNPDPIRPIGLKHLNLAKESAKLEDAVKEEPIVTSGTGEIPPELVDATFVHLHCHSQFSILQATSDTSSLIKKAKEFGMPAVALTDHANMMGAFQFVSGALKNEITPIVGCEMNVCGDKSNKQFKDNGYQVVLLAKNKKGYHNLAKLSSQAFTEGYYYVPRIDKETLLKYKEDLMVLSGGLWGPVPNLILTDGKIKAEEELLWWKEQFGEDFYIEINRHNIEEERHVNPILIDLARQHDVKIIAANNTYYTTQGESNAHDILLCVRDGEYQSKPKKYYGKKGREFRYGFPNEEFYMKSSDEMKRLFADLPEAILNIQEVVDKVEEYKLARDVLLPAFDIPERFQDERDQEDGGKRGENNYLRHITYEGAKKRYGEITDDIAERLDFELQVIANTGYPGYFLIVEDFIREARNMGVSVGPGRGSAAGSAVAYCVAITNIDPIKYDLLFERFLNPERVSMPDIDIDFDDVGRQKVIDYVIDKYGANQVAQIITYGSMAAKSSVRDTGRVMELPLQDTGRLANLIPASPGTTMKKIFGKTDKELKEKFRSEDLALISELVDISQGNSREAEVINQARMIEGSLRNTGIHACGVIITPDDITNYVPVATAKDSEMYCTQFDNSVVEDAGLLKMDFLGLKTLTLIKDACQIVKDTKGIELDPDHFSLEDEVTYELFQRGETVGVFQYESPGMQKHLKDLKPTVFADLIAMNALYRPGPMEYIPSFIDRKHGRENIEYDLPAMEEYLEETYGITVYQEQVMLLSQKLAGFTKGEADVLRKAMGKKKKDVLEKMKPQFINQAMENGHPEEKLEKIWKDWEAFASYAFNKSHSTCYAWVAYQTAYLKAHHPAAYMASVLSNNMNQITSITFFMDECRRMGLDVLGPSVNESRSDFFVNEQGQIRFGLNAIKGTGGAAVSDIIKERDENGEYEDFFDFAKRVNLRTVNKKTFESLAQAGAFDCFPEVHRAQYFYEDVNGGTFIEIAIKYGAKLKAEADTNQHSLFGDSSESTLVAPKPPDIDPWPEIKKLKLEREVVGIYISGHPLDNHRLVIDFYGKGTLSDLETITEDMNGREFALSGIVSSANHMLSKAGKQYGIFELEDYNGSHKFFLFKDNYLEYKRYLDPGVFMFIKGRVKERFRGRDYQGPKEYQLDINSIELLDEVLEKVSKGMRLGVSAEMLTSQTVSELDDIMERYKGKKPVRIDIYANDEEGNTMKLGMFSRKCLIEPSKELYDELAALEGVACRFI